MLLLLVVDDVIIGILVCSFGSLFLWRGWERFLGSDDSLSSIRIFLHINGPKAHFFQHFSQRFSIKWIDFKGQKTRRFEPAERVTGDGVIEKKRVVVGYEECAWRLMLQYMRCHIAALAFADVGWVRHDDVERAGFKGCFVKL